MNWTFIGSNYNINWTTWWRIVSGTRINKLQWNLSQKDDIFIHENAFEKVVCEWRQLGSGLIMLNEIVTKTPSKWLASKCPPPTCVNNTLMGAKFTLSWHLDSKQVVRPGALLLVKKNISCNLLLTQHSAMIYEVLYMLLTALVFWCNNLPECFVDFCHI